MTTRATSSSRPIRARRDATATRKALIAAAIGEFSAKGFEGARVDEIARSAQVNKQLVYHYFDSKQGLYLVALESVYAEIREEEKQLSLGALDPLQAMSQLVAFSFDYLAAHPEFIALLADENRNKGQHILGSTPLRKMHSPFIGMLEATLERGVATGVFHDKFDAINLYISIAGISYFFFSNNHTLSAIFGRDLMSHKARAERLSHMCDVILGYVLKD